jgi:hypothetical protein
MKEFDLTPFNFHIFEGKPYVAIDPQSAEENDRLEKLLEANALCAKVFKRALKGMKPGSIAMLIEPRQVGWTRTGECVLLVVEGSYGRLPDGKAQINGHWYVVRVPESGFEELKAALAEEMEDRKRHMSNRGYLYVSPA